MKTLIHPAKERGMANHGWLNAAHSFSFANWYNPEKMQFGALRVLNDDIVAPGRGFGEHPHDNMEIVTIPLTGSLKHKDSLGSEGMIKNGEVQIMSAGTGIYHSEFNASQTEAVNLLQLWVFPKEKNIEPRYDQFNYQDQLKQNQLLTVVSPEKSEKTMWINQDAYFTLGDFDADANAKYSIKKPGNGAYVFLIEGKAVIAGNSLAKRDAVGVYDTQEFELEFKEPSKVLIVEVPM